MRYILFVLLALFVTIPASAATDGSSGSMTTSTMGDNHPSVNSSDNDTTWNVDDWDSNNDNALDRSEFLDGYEAFDIFEHWDVNNDDVLDQDELGDGLYDSWDRNSDGLLEEDELEDSNFGD